MSCPICQQSLDTYSLLGRIEHVDNCLIAQDDTHRSNTSTTIESYFPSTNPSIPKKRKELPSTFKKFLQSLGLENYLKVFIREEIEPEILLQCNFKDLKNIGLSKAAATRILHLRRQLLAVCIFSRKKSRQVRHIPKKSIFYYPFSSLLSSFDGWHPEVVQYRYR
ncbi:hypothetical protein GAYE_SCF22MG4226 [Galdieria yellowstonensis]|uniref:SAM domain-containing protein n=1 Tax=Galdieria yellowstonensis TaxID=3028027 RepID=A0AAV9IFZ0_9RHOD|nr:hypothetical protein GAYE_SCF22MG4226 [Galdieria yellowstonensis]